MRKRVAVRGVYVRGADPLLGILQLNADHTNLIPPHCQASAGEATLTTWRSPWVLFRMCECPWLLFLHRRGGRNHRVEDILNARPAPTWNSLRHFVTLAHGRNA
jgi:hypothetical protein